MAHVCGAAKDDFVAYKRDHQADFYARVEARDDGRILYIMPRYVSLYHTDDQKVPLARVQDNHHTANLIFSQQNTSELNEVPEDDLHPWRALIGNLKVQMLPLDKSQVTVSYVKINTNSLSNTQPVADAASRAGVEKGLLNVFFGRTTSNILGQAERPGIIAFVDERAVGGFEENGEFSSYNLGKTMVHEILHCLNLTHTFSDLECDNQRIVIDVPEQIQPNFNSRIVFKNGKWSQENDNRAKDRVSNQNRSCVFKSSAPETNVNEMAPNIMDYNNDSVSRMITKGQVTIARDRLLNNNNDLTLFDANGVAQNTIGGLTTVQIIFIAIGSALVFLFLASVLYYRNKGKGVSKSRLKFADSYVSFQPAYMAIYKPGV